MSKRDIHLLTEPSVIRSKIGTDYSYSKATVHTVVVEKSKIALAGLPGKNKKVHWPLPLYHPEFYTDLTYPVARAMPVVLQITFDNDIFDETDYYYTNGVRLELITPLAMDFPLRRVLLQPKNRDLLFTGFSLRQNMYTPTNPEAPFVLQGDHPFAGYLVFGQFVQSVNYQKKITLFSEINLGIIGPASLAGTIQYSVHERKPVGWANQIHNDMIVNYSVRIEKGLVSNTHFELNLKALAHVGTLYDKAALGVYFRTGSFIPVYRGPWFTRQSQKQHTLQYWFFVTGQSTGVLYDATLQGGLFSRSIYTIGTADIKKLVVQASAGVALYYGGFGLELENFYQSPQFRGASDFRWGRIKVVMSF